MAHILRVYPPVDDEEIVRGDPLTIGVNFQVGGVDVDISTWTVRAYVRNTTDGPLVTQFQVTKTVGPTPGVTSRAQLYLPPSESRKLAKGQCFDVEQTAPVQMTWLIVEKIRVAKDVSWT